VEFVAQQLPGRLGRLDGGGKRRGVIVTHSLIMMVASP
jgi:hypothetical protein